MTATRRGTDWKTRTEYLQHEWVQGPADQEEDRDQGRVLGLLMSGGMDGYAGERE